MYKGNKRESVLKEVGGVVCIIGEAKVVGVRVWAMTVILERGVTRMDPIKISGIKDWPTPTKVKDVQSFLGFCNFYCAFIQGFAHVA